MYYFQAPPHARGRQSHWGFSASCTMWPFSPHKFPLPVKLYKSVTALCPFYSPAVAPCSAFRCQSGLWEVWSLLDGAGGSFLASGVNPSHPSPLCAQNHPGSPETLRCFVEAQTRIKELSKGKKKHQTWLKHSQINPFSPCLLYHCRTSPFVQQPLTAPY